MSDRNGVKTYKDFPEFYDNPFIKKIAKNEKWTISDKDKRPIDMKALFERQQIWGASFTRGYNPFVDLQTLITEVPDATNNAYYLDAETDGYVVLDIEPTCPETIKTALCQLPNLYGEISMSGKGLHLVFELPKQIWDKYPAIHNKVVLKEKHKYYEILLNHMVTFTRNTIPSPYNPKSKEEFERVFETLAREAKQSSITSKNVVVTNIDTEKIPMFKRTMSVLLSQKYKKTPEDFFNDMSKYEFGMAGFYYHTLTKLTKNSQYKDIKYSDEDKTIIIYKLLENKLPHRPKHDTERSGMPWLMYIAAHMVSLHIADDQNKKKGD